MEFKIISFNIRNGNDPDGNSIEERAPRLREILSVYDADILCMQEYVPKWKKYIRKHYRRQYKMFFRYRGHDSKEAAPVLWKKSVFRCVRKGVFWMSDTPEKCSRGWDELYDVPRICTYVVLRHRATGKEITVINTHFGFGESCQMKSAQLISDYSKKISESPAVITGDFNMTVEDSAYSIMTVNFKDTSGEKSINVPTYHGYNKVEASHIDFCFVDDCLQVVKEKVIDETIDGKFPSDHNGLFIQLKLVDDYDSVKGKVHAS